MSIGHEQRQRVVEQLALLPPEYVLADGTRFVPHADLLTHQAATGGIACEHLSTDYCVVTRLAELRGEPDPHTRTPHLYRIIPPTTTYTEPDPA